MTDTIPVTTLRELPYHFQGNINRRMAPSRHTQRLTSRTSSVRTRGFVSLIASQLLHGGFCELG